MPYRQLSAVRRDFVSPSTGGGTGTVISVGLSAPAELAVAGSPVTTAGTLELTWATQTANKVFASATSGGTATPAFRALVAADIPTTVAVAGDVTGTLAATTVAKINGVAYNADPLAQYALLAGRAGGQVLNGGTAAGDRLDLAGSSHVNMGPLTVSTGARTLSGLRGLISLDPTLSHPGGLLNALYGIEIGARNSVVSTWTVTANMTVGGLSGAFGMNFAPMVRNAAATSITELGAWGLFANNLGLKAFGNNLIGTTADTSFVRMILDTPTITTDGVAGAVATLNELTTVYCRPTINPNTKTAQVTARRGVWFRDQATASQGAQPTAVAIDVDNQTSSGAFTISAALRSAITDAAGKYFLRDTGGARSVISGKVRLGDTTDPSTALDLQGGLTIKRTTVANANYTVLGTDLYIGYTSITVARTVTLPTAANSVVGQAFVIADESGAVTATITITVVPGTGTEKINGAASLILNTAYACQWIIRTGLAGHEWKVI